LLFKYWDVPLRNASRHIAMTIADFRKWKADESRGKRCPDSRLVDWSTGRLVHAPGWPNPDAGACR
jgi:hypothetical protein